MRQTDPHNYVFWLRGFLLPRWAPLKGDRGDLGDPVVFGLRLGTGSPYRVLMGPLRGPYGGPLGPP